jgi:Tol biopolymer transport system component
MKLKFEMYLRFFISSTFLVLLTSSFSSAEEIKITSNPFNSGRIAFSYTSKAGSEIYVLDFAKRSVLPLRPTPLSEGIVENFPRWSPDGTKLLFNSNRSGQNDLYVADATTLEIKNITNSASEDYAGDWTPDGKKIIFTSNKNGKEDLWSINANGFGSSIMPNRSTLAGEKKFLPRVSPRNDELLYCTDVDWPGTDLRRYEFKAQSSFELTFGRYNFCREQSSPSWSFDGSLILFSHGAGTEADIWVIKKSPKERKISPLQLTSAPGREYDPIFISDQDKIFYVGQGSAEGVFKIFLLDLKTKESTQITTNLGDIRHLSWTAMPSLPPRPRR